MKNFFIKNEKLLNVGVIIGFISFFLTFLTTFSLQMDKMSIIKISFLPLIFGFYYFFTFIISSVISLNKINSITHKNREKQPNKLKQILFIAVVSFALYYILDSIVFFFDDSLSKDYANGILSITENPTEKDITEIENLSKLPFCIQNSFLNIISFFFSILFSYIFVKKFKD